MLKTENIISRLSFPLYRGIFFVLGVDLIYTGLSGAIAGGHKLTPLVLHFFAGAYVHIIILEVTVRVHPSFRLTLKKIRADK